MRNILEDFSDKKKKLVPYMNVDATTTSMVSTDVIHATEIHVTIMAICSSLTPIK